MAFYQGVRRSWRPAISNPIVLSRQGASSFKDRQFIDRKVIQVKAGHGGSGSISLLRKSNRPRLGPDGGDGGRGGSVILKADHNTSCLRRLLPSYKAKRGGEGEGGGSGRGAEDVILLVPCGTVARDKHTGELLCDLVRDQQEHIIALGGVAGLGNVTFKSDVNQTPREATLGTAGEERDVVLEMQSIADVGLVGFPNAGKSSFLRSISRATPKVADYPFTTIHPTIGVMEYNDMAAVPVADLPGIIEGAHLNKGLGLAFLKHIERCRSLLFVIDISNGAENACMEYDKLCFELEQYRVGLSKLPSAVIATKVDIADNVSESLEKLREHTGLDAHSISSKTGVRIPFIKHFLQQFHQRVEKDDKDSSTAAPKLIPDDLCEWKTAVSDRDV